MTNDRAVEMLNAIIFLLDENVYSDEVEEAIHMAINALKKEAWKEEHPVSPLLQKLATDLQPCKQDDLISRQAAIDAILAVTGNSSVRELYEHVQENGLSDMWSGGVNAAIDIIIAVPPAQPDSKELSFTHKALDTISRQAAIDALTRKMVSIPTAGEKDLMGDVNRIRAEDISVIRRLPSAQPEIIHCHNCKHWREGTVYSYCDKLFGMGVLDTYDYMTDEDDYCSMAERKTDEKENI